MQLFTILSIEQLFTFKFGIFLILQDVVGNTRLQAIMEKRSGDILKLTVYFNYRTFLKSCNVVLNL